VKVGARGRGRPLRTRLCARAFSLESGPGEQPVQRRSRLGIALLISLLWVSAGVAQRTTPDAPPKITAGKAEHGRVERINGYWVVTVEGTPAQMGKAYGRLLGPVVRRVIADLIHQGFGRDRAAYANILAGSRVMAKHQPGEYLEEIRALAGAAKVSRDDLLMLQYFGDVRRCIRGAGAAFMCTSFAVLPPHTRDRSCIAGRNLDYFDHGVGEYASILACYRPKGKIPFVTVTWAGIINGWTLLNEKGIVTSNNTAFGARNQSLEGISTCFLLRRIAENADTVAKGVAIVRKGPRTCGTNLLIAGGDPPTAAIVEFDHRDVTVRRARDGFVGATNSLFRLYDPDAPESDLYWGRLGTVRSLIGEHRGKVDIRTRLAGAAGVPLRGMNLHSAMVDTAARRIRVAMGRIPACDLPYRTFQLTAKGLVGVKEADDGDGE